MHGPSWKKKNTELRSSEFSAIFGVIKLILAETTADGGKTSSLILFFCPSELPWKVICEWSYNWMDSSIVIRGTNIERKNGLNWRPIWR
jgi:hypothetical protein